MSRYISKLTEPIRALAEKRREKQNPNSKEDELINDKCFIWEKTPEGHRFWSQINKQNYSVFYDLYPQKDKLDELIEWVNMEYPNFNLEDFNNKAKEIKGNID